MEMLPRDSGALMPIEIVAKVGSVQGSAAWNTGRTRYSISGQSVGNVARAARVSAVKFERRLAGISSQPIDRSCQSFHGSLNVKDEYSGILTGITFERTCRQVR